MAKKEEKQLELSVVGMNHRVTPATLEQIADDLPLKVALQREPDNSHDENAIKVVITEKPWRRKNTVFHIGYIARAAAAVIAPALDEGGDGWPYNEAWLTSVDIDAGRGELLLKKSKAAKEIQA